MKLHRTPLNANALASRAGCPMSTVAAGRVLGLDPSLTGTGFALVEFTGPQGWSAQTWSRGRTGRRNESLVERDDRITSIAADLHETDLRALDLAAIEQPAFGAPGGSTWDRAGLWWRLVSRLISYEVPVVQVSSPTRQKFAVGYAHSKKNPVDKADIAMAAARMWPGVSIKGNNAADALVIASAGAVLLGLPVPFEVFEYRRAALEKVTVPADERGAA